MGTLLMVFNNANYAECSTDNGWFNTQTMGHSRQTSPSDLFHLLVIEGIQLLRLLKVNAPVLLDRGFEPLPLP